MDYTKSSWYFHKASEQITSWVIMGAGLFIGIFFACYKIMPQWISSVVLIIAVAIIGLLINWAFKVRVSDKEIDDMVLEESKKLKNAALRKFGMEEEEIALAEPIKFINWNYAFLGKRGVIDGTTSMVNDILGKDKIWRSPVIEMHFFAFSENSIHHYCQFRSLMSDAIREITEEFFYKDIVSVKTDMEMIPKWDFKQNKEIPGEVIKYDSFKLNSSGGNSISCSVQNSSVAEEAVNAMKTLLKQKKAEA